MEFKVREAGPADAVSIGRLYESLVPNDNHIDVTPERISQISSDKNNYLWVISENGQVCGTAFLTFCLDPMYGEQPYAVIENVIIDEHMRNKGYGRRLMEWIESFCREHQCSKIMLCSSIHRVSAHKFFSSRGFHDDRKKAFVKYFIDYESKNCKQKKRVPR